MAQRKKITSNNPLKWNKVIGDLTLSELMSGGLPPEQNLFDLDAPVLALSSSTSSTVTLSWGAVTNADTYTIQESSDGITWANLNTVTQLSITDGTPPSPNAYYRVRANNSVKNSNWSNVLSLTKKRLNYNGKSLTQEDWTSAVVVNDTVFATRSTGVLVSYNYQNNDNWSPLDTLSGLIDPRNLVQIDNQYITCQTQGGIVIFDISDPTNISQVETGNGGFINNGLAISGSYLYEVSEAVDTLYIFDISDPTNIPAPSSLADATDNGKYGALSVTSDGNYLISDGVQGFIIWDISTPSAPVKADSLAQTAISSSDGTGCLISDDYYIRNGNVSGEFEIYDITTKTSISYLTNFTAGSNLITHSKKLNGDYVFLFAAGENFVYSEFLDVSAPASPSSVIGDFELEDVDRLNAPAIYTFADTNIDSWIICTETTGLVWYDISATEKYFEI